MIEETQKAEKQPKNLELNETLRDLTEAEAAAVQGGLLGVALDPRARETAVVSQAMGPDGISK